MREGLIQTSSIFTKPEQEKGAAKPGTESFQAAQEEMQVEGEARCRTFRFESREGNITLRDFFPDSLNCVIYNSLSDKFFAGNLGEETIHEFPISQYTVELVAQTSVILRVWANPEDEETQYMILTSRGYILTDKLEIDEQEGTTKVKVEGKTYDIETTETKEPEVDEAADSITYNYKGNQFIVESGKRLYHNSKNTKLLLANEYGTYIGYYLPVSQGGEVNLQGKKCKVKQRLTLALAVVEDTGSQRDLLLSCSSQLLMEMEDFGATSYQHIEIVNGVALLIEEDTHVFNIFTPQHQRIILEPKYKINDKAVGNGLYFEKDDVLLLDNGSLVFTKRLNKKTLDVRGREVKLPIEYLGDVE